MPNWDNGLAILAFMLFFSWMLSGRIFDYLRKLGFNFDKSIKKATLWFVFSIMFDLTICVLILYSLLFRWPV